LPFTLTRLVARAVHFVMQRRQLLGIKRRAEAMPAGTILRNDHSGSAKDAAS
jgi:heme exporter protein D